MEPYLRIGLFIPTQQQQTCPMCLYVVTDVQISFIKGTQQQHNISLHDFKRAAYSHKRVKMLVWL